jgi:hypothetical protein
MGNLFRTQMTKTAVWVYYRYVILYKINKIFLLQERIKSKNFRTNRHQQTIKANENIIDARE